MKINILHAGYCTAPEHIAMHEGKALTTKGHEVFSLFPLCSFVTLCGES
jgi:hypothetical protein